MRFRTGRSIPSITPHGRMVHEVCLTESGGVWQARIRTLPRQVWMEPGGQRVLCFDAPTPEIAEALAVDFIQRDVVARGHRLENPAMATAYSSHIEPARRIHVHVPVRYREAHLRPDRSIERVHVATTGNVSESGLFIITPTLLRPRTLISIDVRFPGLMSRLEGIVMWSRQIPRPGLATGMGVRLSDPSLDYRSRVQGL